MVELEVRIMKNASELEDVEPFQVNQLLWGTKEVPHTYGYLGFVPEDGFYLKMVCEEREPLRTFDKALDPVYRDSAMEAFFQFEPGRAGRRELYVNFEVNANGALLASYGEGRTYRSYFSHEEMEEFRCEAKMEEDRWSAVIRIPLSVLEKIYGALHLEAGSTFTCNFYKISEQREIEHYASYAPIKTSVPSFHLPEYFAAARIVEG